MKRLFIPKTFAKVGKRFFTDSRLVLLFGLLITLALSEGFLVALNSELYGMPIVGTQAFMIFTMIADVWLHVFLARVFVVKEKDLKASYQKWRDNHITTLKPFWSVFDIEDGKLMYIDGRVGMLVYMKHGFVYGRPPQHRLTHYHGVTQFMGELSLKGYELRQFNLQVVDPNTDGLDKLQAGMARIRNTPLYNYQKAVYNHVRDVCQKVSTVEHEYYLVIGNTMAHILNIDADVRAAMGYLQGTLMTGIHTATNAEVYEFIQVYNNITYADVKKLKTSQVYGGESKLIKVLEVYYSDDEVARLAVEKIKKPEVPVVSAEVSDIVAKLLKDEQEADSQVFSVISTIYCDEDDVPTVHLEKQDTDGKDPDIHVALTKPENQLAIVSGQPPVQNLLPAPSRMTPLSWDTLDDQDLEDLDLDDLPPVNSVPSSLIPQHVSQRSLIKSSVELVVNEMVVQEEHSPQEKDPYSKLLEDFAAIPVTTSDVIYADSQEISADINQTLADPTTAFPRLYPQASQISLDDGEEVLN